MKSSTRSPRDPEALSAEERTYTVIGHRRGQPCPMCKQSAFCDDCGMCEVCEFAPPDVTSDEPCNECGEGCLHARTCSVTLRSVAN